MIITPSMLTIIDTINEWNEKLNELIGDKMGNVGIGTLIFFGILLVTFWAIGALNKQ